MRGIHSRGDESHGIEISASLRTVTAWTDEVDVVPHAFDQAEFGRIRGDRARSGPILS